MKFGDERLPPRIWRKIDQVDGHWIWRGAFSGQPQTRWKVGDKHKTVNVRRLIFDLDRPSGSEAIGARCRNRACVTPGCLFAATSAEISRWNAEIARSARDARGTCRLGHDLAAVGIHTWTSNGHTFRHCKACQSISAKKYQDKRRRRKLARMRGARRKAFQARSARMTQWWASRALWAAPTNGAQTHA